MFGDPLRYHWSAHSVYRVKGEHSDKSVAYFEMSENGSEHGTVSRAIEQDMEV